MDGNNPNIKIDITADVSGLNAGTTEAGAKLNQLSSSFDKTGAAARAVNDPINAVEASSNKLSAVLSRLPGIGLGVGGVLVALSAGAYAMARGAIEAADALHAMHLKTGISVEQLAAWDVVTKKSNTTLGSLTQGLKNASTYIVDHADRLRAMGIQAKTSEEVLFKVSEIISRLPVDDPRRMALAMDVFGKSAQDLLPLLAEGEDKLRAMLERGKELNPVTAKMAEEANLFNSNLVEFNMLGKQFGTTIANEMLPELNTLLEQLLEGQKIAGGFWNALLLFGTTNPFRTPTENIRAYKEEIAGLEEDRARFLKFGASTDSIDTVIAGLQKKIKFVEVLQRQGMADINKLADEQQQALMKKMNSDNYLAAIEFAKKRNGGVLTQDAALDIGRQAYPEEFIQLDKIDKPKKTRTSSGAHIAADPYIAFSKQMNERAALLDAQANQTDKLTETEQFAVKVMEDLRNSSLKLTEAQKIETTGTLERMLALDKTNQARLHATEALAAQMDVMRSLTGEFDRNDAAQRRAMEVMPEAQRRLGTELDKVAKGADTARVAATKFYTDGKLSGDEYFALLQKITDESERQSGKMQQLADDQDALNASWEYGARTAMQKYLDEIQNVARQTENMVTRAFKGMEDSLAKFVRTGKLDFTSLADNIINDLIRIQIQQNITQPLSAAMNSGGGVLDMIGSLFGGGTSSAPASVGATASTWTSTSMPLIPSFEGGGFTGMGARSGGLDGRGGFLSLLHPQEDVIDRTRVNGGSSAAQVVLQVNIVNNASQQVSATATPNSSGGFDLLIEQIEGGIARNVQRGTGALNGALSQTFGLNRAPGAF